MSQVKGWWRRRGGGPCYTIGGGDWRRRCSKAKPGFEKPQKLRLSRSCLAPTLRLPSATATATLRSCCRDSCSGGGSPDPARASCLLPLHLLLPPFAPLGGKTSFI